MPEGLGVVVGAVVGALITLIVQGLAIRESKRIHSEQVLDSQRTRAQAALEWMTGDSQRRNVGIAAIEASWSQWTGDEFQDLVIPVLCGSATYLLCASGQADKGHELFNLDRIMTLLTTRTSAEQLAKFKDGLEIVLQAVRDNRNKAQMPPEDRKKLGRTGLFVASNNLNAWEASLVARGLGRG